LQFAPQPKPHNRNFYRQLPAPNQKPQRMNTDNKTWPNELSNRQVKSEAFCLPADWIVRHLRTYLAAGDVTKGFLFKAN
jgi:hypothetical protein